MINDPKLLFIIDTIKSAYANYGTYDKSSLTDNAMFDLVTSTDFNIENYIISKIKAQYPQDKILSEETNSHGKRHKIVRNTMRYVHRRCA